MSTLARFWDANRLRLLVELERAGSLSAAAGAIGITQPTASQHLRRLEGAAGQPLVVRGGPRLRLTEAGRALVRHAVRALAELEEAEEEMSAQAGLLGGTIRLGASTTAAAYMLPAALACFAGKFPDVGVELRVTPSEEAIARLLGRQIGIAIVGEAGERDGRIVFEPMIEDEIVGITRPGLLGVEEGEIDAAGLIGSRLLVREAGSATQACVDLALSGLDVEPAGCWKIGSTEAIVRMVREGLGLAFVSAFAAEDDLRSGALERFTVRDMQPMRRLFSLAHLASEALSPAERRFAAVLSACCAELHPDGHLSRVNPAMVAGSAGARV